MTSKQSMWQQNNKLQTVYLLVRGQTWQTKPQVQIAGIIEICECLELYPSRILCTRGGSRIIMQFQLNHLQLNKLKQFMDYHNFHHDFKPFLKDSKYASLAIIYNLQKAESRFNKQNACMLFTPKENNKTIKLN